MTSPRIRRAPGWYRDASDPTRVRHWTGRAWSGRERGVPGWHLVGEDLAPDASWANPGGVSRSLRDRPPLGWPAGDQLHRHPLPEDPTSHPLGHPELGDHPLTDHLLEGPTLDRPRPVDRHRRGSSRHDPFRSTSMSARAAAAAFGVQPMSLGYGTRMGGPWTRRPLPSAGWPSPGGPGELTPSSWRQNRTSLAMFLGILLLGMLALFISVGADSPNHLSVVALDAAFVRPANAACAAALGTRSAERRAASSTGTSRSPATIKSSSSADHRTAPEQAGSSSTPRQPGTWSARVSTLADRLRQLPLTPSAAPQVDAWLTQWQHYLEDEHAMARAQAAHDTSRAEAAAKAARLEAASADSFAVGNGLAACALDPSDVPNLELIP